MIIRRTINGHRMLAGVAECNDSPTVNLHPAKTEFHNSTHMQESTCVVGPGWCFTSGISYYTCQLANALSRQGETSVVQMRRLLPRRMYPGRERVGEPRSRMSFAAVDVLDGVDWWWGRSIFLAVRFLARKRPSTIVMQWWTATVLHTYLVLAVTGRLVGSRLVIELHEIQDSGEGRIPLARWYGRVGLGLLLRLCDACVVHSASDGAALGQQYRLDRLRLAAVPHGPFDQYREGRVESDHLGALAAVTAAPRPNAVNLLFFGTIRPYKGLSELLHAFNSLAANESTDLWLTVVGETWEGCTEPSELIDESPYKRRISFVNYYVPDEIVYAAFEHADIVVLPYHRSSSSGPLHVAMSFGLPIVVTRVGGLEEASDGYGGAIFVMPKDAESLAQGIRDAIRLIGNRYEDPRSWSESVAAILGVAASGARRHLAETTS